MEYFHEDVMVSIFSRLPAKPLIRFKCLSKFWSVVFSDSKFSRMQLKTCVRNYQDFILQYCDLAFILKYGGNYPELSRLRIDTCFNGCEGSLIAEDMECPLQVQLDVILNIAHCDGILCMFCENDGTQSAIVWNPITREHKRFALIGLSSWEAFGFGYDSVIDDYKVVHIKGSGFKCGLRLRNIYSIRLKKAGIDDWNAALNEVPYCFTIPSINEVGMAVNGCLYWIAIKQDDFGKKDCYVILCFDLGKESLREETSLCGEGIFYELGNSTQLFSCLLGFLGNSLCLSRTYDGIYTDFFVMEENEVKKTKYWIKLMRILWDGPEKELDNLFGLPICVTRNGQILTNELKTGFFLFNQDGSVKKIAIHGLRLLPYQWFHVTPYVESLVSPIT